MAVALSSSDELFSHVAALTALLRSLCVSSLAAMKHSEVSEDASRPVSLLSGDGVSVGYAERAMFSTPSTIPAKGATVTLAIS